MKRLTLNKSTVKISTKEVTCKHCGSEQVQWRDTGAGWRLYDIGGNRHFCDGFRASTAMATVAKHAVSPQRVLSAITDEFYALISDGVEFNHDKIKVLFEQAKANAIMRIML